MEDRIYYFEEDKLENTDTILDLVKKKALETGMKHVVVASTRGFTGLKAAETLKSS